MINKNLVLKRENNKPIVWDAFFNNNNNKKPLVIFCHGYKGFKDWGAWNVMAKEFATQGYCVIKFNFAYNGGTVEQPIDFPNLNAFGNNNYTKELDDLDSVLNWVEANLSSNNNINTNNITLLGHSRGGGIVTIKAEEDSRISNIISLAGICDFGKRTATIGNLEEWKKEGVKYVLNGRTKQQMPHFYQFYTNFKENENRLFIENSVKNLKIPLLIIHGDNDTSISLDEGKKIDSWCSNSKLEIIENADHVFNVSHPWLQESLSKELEEVKNLCIHFLD